MVSHYDGLDPLAVFTAPPPNETQTEKAAREAREAEARRISDCIDEQLRAEGFALQKQERSVKIVLLGQCQSATSAFIDCFRVRFARDQWEQERASLRAVVQLNLVHSVNTILDALQQALDSDGEIFLPFTGEHRLLQVRLRPLCGVEDDLKRLLVVQADMREPQSSHMKSSPRPVKHDGASSRNVTEAIANHKSDIMALWADHVVRNMLQAHGVHLEDPASFFLDHTERIAVRDYEPTVDDIVHVRPRTADILEYEFDVEEYGKSRPWKIYDIGGPRTQRHAWLPYFDQADAIIFLVPVSRFNERLQEDPQMSQLEDSFTLWKSICSSRLLSQATFILIFHEVHLLEKKITDGTQVKHYIPSYEGPNEILSVVKYFRQKFNGAVKRNSPEPRMCHIFTTSDIDQGMIVQTLSSVRDGILRAHLKKANIRTGEP